MLESEITMVTKVFCEKLWNLTLCWYIAEVGGYFFWKGKIMILEAIEGRYREL